MSIKKVTKGKQIGKIKVSKKGLQQMKKNVSKLNGYSVDWKDDRIKNINSKISMYEDSWQQTVQKLAKSEVQKELGLLSRKLNKYTMRSREVGYENEWTKGHDDGIEVCRMLIKDRIKELKSITK